LLGSSTCPLALAWRDIEFACPTFSQARADEEGKVEHFEIGQ
jgi:hypothetical protein